MLSRSLTLRLTQLIRMQAWRTLNVNGGCTKWPLMSLCYDRKCACAKSVAQHAEYKRWIHIGCLNDGVDQRQNKPLRENRVFFSDSEIRCLMESFAWYTLSKFNNAPLHSNLKPRQLDWLSDIAAFRSVWGSVPGLSSCAISKSSQRNLYREYNS